MAVPTHGCQEPARAAAPYQHRREGVRSPFSAVPAPHPHPARGECPADVRGPYFISWHRGRIFAAVSCGRAQERRWNWNRRARPHLRALQLLKLPGAAGAELRLGLWERGSWALLSFPGRNLLPSPGRTHQGNPGPRGV